jgi:hypothetical protein
VRILTDGFEKRQTPLLTFNLHLLLQLHNVVLDADDNGYMPAV